MEKQICSICKKEFSGWGNNAEPINDGVCCDDCNNFVIMVRLEEVAKEMAKIR